jgi:hypothetical protein
MNSMPHNSQAQSDTSAAQAGDVDYAVLGTGYASRRRTDPRIEALVHAALGNAKTVLNIGAGAGSYEPRDRHVIAIEPAEAMRRQRPAFPARVPAIIGRAESLPLDDKSVDASMAILTVHQWQDAAAGTRELHRVTRGPIVVVTFDGDALHRWWLADYAPELIEAERARYQPMAELLSRLSTPRRQATAAPIPIPIDCVDGFTEAFYARPEMFLDPNVTRAQSAWAFVSQDVRDRFARSLEADLRHGTWDAKHGAYRTQPVFHGALRLIVGGDVC